MAQSKHTPEMPDLPVGSIDFDKLSRALAAGKPGEEAVAAALHVPEPAPEAEEPAAASMPSDQE